MCLSVMKQRLVIEIAFHGSLKPLLSKQHVAMAGINKVKFLLQLSDFEVSLT